MGNKSGGDKDGRERHNSGYIFASFFKSCAYITCYSLKNKAKLLCSLLLREQGALDLSVGWSRMALPLQEDRIHASWVDLLLWLTGSQKSPYWSLFCGFSPPVCALLTAHSPTEGTLVYCLRFWKEVSLDNMLVFVFWSPYPCRYSDHKFCCSDTLPYFKKNLLFDCSVLFLRVGACACSKEFKGPNGCVFLVLWPSLDTWLVLIVH